MDNNVLESRRQIITDSENHPHQFSDDPFIGKTFKVTAPKSEYLNQIVTVLAIDEWGDCSVLLGNGEIYSFINWHWLKPILSHNKGINK